MKEKIQNFMKGMAPKNVLFIMTVVCIAVMGITYLDSSIAKPFRDVVGYVTVPLQQGVNQIGSWGSKLFQEEKEKQELLARIEELELQIENYQSQISFYQSDLEELEHLREMLELRDSYQNYDMVGASIIAKDDGSWYNRFTIDKGTKDGIQEGNNVIADGGLVGIVESAMESYSIVKAIIDDNVNVSAMSKSSQELCIVSGNLTLIGDGCMDIYQIAADSSIKSGTQIVTSNVSDRYLPGILIGTVKSVTIDANQLTMSGYIIPAVNFKTLKDVFVLLGKKEVDSTN